MSWVLSQLESRRLLVTQGGHLTTRKSHCKAAADGIMCRGGGEGGGMHVLISCSIRGSSFGGKAVYLGSG